ncbi:site-2 protease family protein [Actinomyces lilanjuaniae]|uniref:site-2 protease family protein n=1 Tax=Actinomyces lilanjuaniae TaxID=2321394 RepID=UPI001FA9736D|nr:site-2 protease family protein [Actinomyces lilanjuaniae]
MSQALAYALGIVVMVAGIAVSVALHELGHMLPAKKFGVKVPEYFIGFGPRLWSVRRGETEYGVKALWLGGYVKLVGMLPPENPDRPDRRTSSGELGMVGQARADSMEEIAPGEEARAFYRLSVPRKLVVMAGGILTNLLLGVVLLAVSLGVVGVPTSTSSLATVAPASPPTSTPQRPAPRRTRNPRRPGPGWSRGPDHLLERCPGLDLAGGDCPDRTGRDHPGGGGCRAGRGAQRCQRHGRGGGACRAR